MFCTGNSSRFASSDIGLFYKTVCGVSADTRVSFKILENEL